MGKREKSEIPVRAPSPQRLRRWSHRLGLTLRRVQGCVAARRPMQGAARLMQDARRQSRRYTIQAAYGADTRRLRRRGIRRRSRSTRS